MLNIIIYLKKFSPLKLIKKRLYYSEFLLDIVYYYKTKKIFKNQAFLASKPFQINTNKDLGIIFFVGIGDVIFGLPMLKELKSKLHANGSKFHAYVEELPSNFSNPAVFHLLKSCEIFDSVSYFHGRKLLYWKYYDWTSISSEIRLVPFIYKTNHQVKDRIKEVFRQYSISPKISWPDITSSQSEIYKFLVKFLSQQNYINILVHLETRSGDYVYPHLDQVIEYIGNSKSIISPLKIIVFTSFGINKSIFRNSIKSVERILWSRNTNKGMIDYEVFLIELKNGNKIITIDPKNIPLNEQLLIIKNYINFNLAINSYIWAISRMYNSNMAGIHYLDSADGHQFYNNNAIYLTPSIYTNKKMLNSTLAIEGIDYKRLPFNKLMVEYTPEIIYSFFLKRLFLSAYKEI
jgi:hypothetical protein